MHFLSNSEFVAQKFKFCQRLGFCQNKLKLLSKIEIEGFEKYRNFGHKLKFSKFFFVKNGHFLSRTGKYSPKIPVQFWSEIEIFVKPFSTLI